MGMRARGARAAAQLGFPRQCQLCSQIKGPVRPDARDLLCWLGGRHRRGHGARRLCGGFMGGGYGVAEAEARAEKRGIWRGSFDRPQDWRRRQN